MPVTLEQVEEVRERVRSERLLQSLPPGITDIIALRSLAKALAA